MNLVRCDRCKKEMKSYESKRITIKTERRYLLKFDEFYNDRDMCEDCVKEFEKWMKNEKEDSVSKDIIRKEIKELDQAIILEWEKCKDVGVTETFNMLGFAKETLEELIGEDE